MKIPESGPTLDEILSSPGKPLIQGDVMKLAREYNDRYLHWDDLKYKEFGDSTREDVWRLMKLTRSATSSTVNIGNLHLSFNIPLGFQQTLHDLDRDLSAVLSPSTDMDGRNWNMLSADTLKEESIASSRMEGASTTSAVAKKLLDSGSHPKDKSQQMIVNNYSAMKFIKENADKPLSRELILRLHEIVSHNTLEEDSMEGKFRESDDIVVKERYGDTVFHKPMTHTEIDTTVEALCSYINDESAFVHPVIKGIILHFAVAYIHPFVDGNGRVSRSLFYWYAMKKGYSIMEYLSISRIIEKHRTKYDLAYLKTETDEDDLTYFIQYNLEVLGESIRSLETNLENKAKKQKKAADRMPDYGLNLRQSEILGYMIESGEPVSVKELADVHQTTGITVRRDLLAMMDLGLVGLAGKDGHRQLYRYSGKYR